MPGLSEKYYFVPENDSENKFNCISQIGFACRDINKVIDNMRLVFGVEPYRVADAISKGNAMYKGKEAEYSAKIAFYDFANVELEFIQPVEGESVWADHLKENETILHHIRFNMRDVDKAIDDMKAIDIDRCQWGSASADPRWSWTYFDTMPSLGFTLEFLGLNK